MKKNNILYRFLLSNDHIVKDTYLWNMIANFLFAFQSVLLLMVLTRVVDLNESGIFTIAYANASLFLLIGKYGVRNYQVSDIGFKNSFSDYRFLRIISVLIMIVSPLLYIGVKYHYQGYSLYKALIVILVCLYKVPDAIEDVYFGEYQRQGRLDVAAKCMALRLTISIVVLAGTTILLHDLFWALIISNIISILVMLLLLSYTKGNFVGAQNKHKKSGVIFLVKTCFPLFAGTFLAQYISNAPKYAIDSNMSDDIQACYGFIAMPVFVVGLLSSVIFNPIIHKMAEYWEKKNIEKFLKRLFNQIIIILILTIISIIGAWICGIPVLSILYNTDLGDYKLDLIILLIGGGFLAVASLLTVILTIMRRLNGILMGYTVVAAVAFALSDRMVLLFGVKGAVWFYTNLMILLALVFGSLVFIGLKNKSNLLQEEQL